MPTSISAVRELTHASSALAIPARSVHGPTVKP